MASRRRQRVLIVDDSALVLQVLRTALTAAGFEVATARDLSELAAVENPPPDLVLLDVVMAEAFGDDLATVMRGTRGITAPIHLLSSLPEDELAERARAAGIEGWIAKTRGLPHVVARVRELLGSDRGSDEAPLLLATVVDAAETRMRRLRTLSRAGATPDELSLELEAMLGDTALVGMFTVEHAIRQAIETARALSDPAAAQVAFETPTPALLEARLTELESQLRELGAGRRRSGRVLVVTRGDDLVTWLSPLLSRAHIELTTAVDVESAARMDRTLRPDAVLIDAVLADGMIDEVCARLREAEGPLHVPIYLVAGETSLVPDERARRLVLDGAYAAEDPGSGLLRRLRELAQR